MVEHAPATQPGTTQPGAIARRCGPARRVLIVACAGGLLSVCAATATAQFITDPKTENPVFVDESPVVVEGLTRAREHLAAGNIEQAVKTLAKVLDDRAEGLIATEADPMLYEPVRSRVQSVLLSSKVLLDKYREAVGPSSRQMLDAGQLEELQRSRLLTAEGLTATVRLAHQRVLEGRFESGTMLLLELRGHPDLAARSQEVAEAAKLAGRYEPRPGARAALSELVKGTVLPPLEPVAAARADLERLSLGDGSPSRVVDDLVSQPTGTGVFGDASMSVQPLRWMGDEQTPEQLPPFARELRCWPAVGEHAVYFSDGATVSGFDRVSMRRLWSVEAADLLRLAPEDKDRNQNGLRHPWPSSWEEVVQPVLTAGSSLLVAVVGRDYDNGQGAEGEEHLVAFDARSGEVRYTVPLHGLDEQLGDAFERGPLITDGRVVVVHMLKRQNQRRLLATMLVGVDASTGKKLWTRVVGSAGLLPFYRAQAMTDSTVADKGVVYRYDRLGVIGAYSIAEGRPLWVRRLNVKVALESPPSQLPWMVHHPQVTPQGLVVLSPDRDEVLVIDASTGMVTARRKASDLYDPEYLVATPTHLVAVGKLQVATLPLNQIETGTPKFSGRLGAGVGGMRGRVTAAGTNIVVPTGGGVVVLNPADPAKPLRTLALDEPGSPLALPEGLMVVDDARVHMYCAWSVAAAHLKEQIAAAPADPGPAAELLSLAERAGKGEEVLPAADSALASLAIAPTKGTGAAEAVELRSAVVATLLRAVERSAGVRVDQQGAKLDAAGVDGALARAKTAAQSPSDKVAVLLASGEVGESRSNWGGAAAAYQQIVDDAALSGAAAPGSGGGSTALAVAVERLTRVVKSGGRGAYAEFDKRFEDAEAALPPAATADTVEALAAEYPVARGGPALWLRAARLHGETRTPQAQRAEARALERGVQSAERAGDTDPAVVGELNGLLVQNLFDRGLLAAAADALARAQSRFPGVTLSVGGKPVAAAEVQGSILHNLAAARHWPRVGTPLAGRAPQVIEGWVLMDPLIHPNGGAGAASSPPFVVLHKGDERRSQVALFGLKPGQLAGEAAEDAPVPLTELWFSQMGNDIWTLVRTDQRGALFFVGEQNGGRLVRIDAEAGKVAWQTEPFGAMFPTDPPAKFGAQLDPQGGKFAVRERLMAGNGEPRSSEIIIATDDRTVCMVERAGRCAAVDSDTGQVLWTNRLPITRIADATVSGGQLVAIGEFPQPQADNKLDRLALFDARTGARSAVNAAPLSGVRYIRTTSRGDLIMGAGGTIAAVNAADLETAKAAWTLTGHPATNAWEAWLLDDRLFLLGDGRSLWEMSALSGAAPAKSIDMQGRLDARTPVTVWQTADGGVAFATGRGLALLDGKGGLKAADAVNAAEGTVAPVVTEGSALLLAPPAQRGGGGAGELGLGGEGGVWNLYRLETAGAQLLSSTPMVFATPPLRMAAIDGRVVISTASGTLVLDAPAAGK